MDSRELTTLPIAPLYKTRLLAAGFRLVEDFESVSAEHLSNDTGLNTTDCEHLIKLISQYKCFVPKSRLASQIYENEESDAPIMTFSEKLDEALGGGIQRGMLTEICGLPGVGKTQLCLQLACDVQLPVIFGGVDGEVIYIDTDGGFVVDRLTDIVKATVKHCQHIARDESDLDIQKIVSCMTEEKFLAGIHVYSCHDNCQLLAMVELLPELLENGKIKLIVIDSVAFHFRHDFDDMSLRTRLLTNLAQTLVDVSRKFYVAVVVTNQMTTKIRQGSDKGSHIIPCLGESWGHACTCRVILQQDGDSRRAWLYKSPSQPQSYTSFQIMADGIRDIVSEPQESAYQQHYENKEEDKGYSDENPNKRQRLI